MKKKVFIHIGTHKTGTTTIQHTLSANQYILEGENIIYIPLPKSLKLIRESKDLEKDTENAITEEIAHIIKSYESHKKFILSWEGFCGYYKDGYESSKFIAKSLSKIFKDYDTYIIIYLRSQDSFIESIYTQEIHVGEMIDFKEFCSIISIYDDFNWHKLINNFVFYFGKNNLIVKSFCHDRLTKCGGLIRDFGDIIGSETLKRLKTIERKNIGYNKGAFEFARIVNPALNNEDKKSLRRILQSISTQKTYSYFSNEDRQKILNAYSDSNNKVYIEFLNGEKFCEDFASFEENASNIFENEYVAIAKVLIKLDKQVNQLEFFWAKNNAELNDRLNEIDNQKLSRLNDKLNYIDNRLNILTSSRFVKFSFLFEKLYLKIKMLCSR